MTGLRQRTAGGVACEECRAWAHDGEQIRHSKRCDSKPQQSVEAPKQAPVSLGSVFDVGSFKFEAEAYALRNQYGSGISDADIADYLFDRDA